MLFLKKISFFILPFFFLLVNNCTDLSTTLDPSDSASSSPSLNYSVSISGNHQDSIHFSLISNGYSDFILPYHFFDNPVHETDSQLVTHLKITDIAGHTIRFTSNKIAIGPVNNKVIHLDGTVYQPVTISYRINAAALNADKTIGQNAFSITDSTVSFLGNAAFIIPFTTSELVPLWRNKHKISVDIICKSSIPLYGVTSSGSYTCDNIYELLFSQIYAGKRPIIEGYGGGTRFAFINFSQSEISIDSARVIGQRFSGILDAVWKTYGAFNNDLLTVAFSSIGGGLEGTFSFTQLPPPNTKFYYILAHEALHQFVGIRCGEYDDPWWKEGGTSYLSYLIAVRQEQYPKDEFRKSITTHFSYGDSTGFNVALSDQWLRANMFPENRFSIVYDKGAQVMMLLDYATRSASDNRYSIEDVSSYLVNRFDGGAFHRSDFLNAFTKFGNPDISNIFKTYVDTAGQHPSDSLLSFTFNKLDSLGAFGSY